MRVLIIEPAGGLWGSERALLDLIEAVPNLEVAVCCPPSTRLAAELDRRGVQVYSWFVERLHLRPRWRRLQAAIGVLRACAAFRPEVLYLNQSGSCRVSLPAARLFGIPIAAHIRIYEDADYLASLNPSPARLRAVIAISSAIECHVRSLAGLAKVRVHTAYDAYAPTICAATDEPRPQRIACVGRIVPIKGQELLIEAMPLLLACHPSAECMILGEGEPSYVAELKHRALATGAAEAISWPGFVRHVGPLLSEAAVLACTSYKEPLGRVIFEAWDAGAVPVVFAGSGGAAEIVRAADAGIVYDHQAPQALADALDLALGLEPKQRRRLVENGRAWMAEHCDPGKYATVIADILEQTIALPKR